MMPMKTMQAVAEHSLFKAATPLVAAALIGSVTWIFVTVMSLDKDIHLMRNQIEDIYEGMKEIEEKTEEIENLITGLRIRFAELLSPGHPYNRIDPYNNNRSEQTGQ
jgi:hypothetical protein